MKALAAGDKVALLSQSLGVERMQFWRAPVPGPVAAAVTCSIERANEANEKARQVVRRALIVLLSGAGLERQDNRKRKLLTCAKTSCTR